MTVSHQACYGCLLTIYYCPYKSVVYCTDCAAQVLPEWPHWFWAASANNKSSLCTSGCFPTAAPEWEFICCNVRKINVFLCRVKQKQRHRTSCYRIIFRNPGEYLCSASVRRISRTSGYILVFNHLNINIFPPPPVQYIFSVISVVIVWLTFTPAVNYPNQLYIIILRRVGSFHIGFFCIV